MTDNSSASASSRASVERGLDGMKTVSCNLCGARDGDPILHGPDRMFDGGDRFQVVRCRGCGLVYVNPRPEGQALSAHYPAEYSAGVRDYMHKPREGTLKLGVDMIMKRRIPPFVPGGRALEIGCGGGSYLLALRERGWEVHGIEMAPDLAEHVRVTLGLDVRTGAAEEALGQIPDGSFDVVAMWHVLEHVTDPVDTVREVHRVLKPGGRFLLEVPNFQSPSRMFLRTYWGALDLPRHLYHFSPATLNAVVEKAGLSVTALRGVPAAVIGTMSLQLLWNGLTRARSARMVLNPALLALLFPASWLLARFRLSAHMSAEAVKPA